jgi:hypothetical protein
MAYYVENLVNLVVKQGLNLTMAWGKAQVRADKRQVFISHREYEDRGRVARIEGPVTIKQFDRYGLFGRSLYTTHKFPEGVVIFVPNVRYPSGDTYNLIAPSLLHAERDALNILYGGDSCAESGACVKWGGVRLMPTDTSRPLAKIDDIPVLSL